MRILILLIMFLIFSGCSKQGDSMAYIGYDTQIKDFDAEYYMQQSSLEEYNPTNNYNVGDKVRIGTNIYEMQDPTNKTLDNDVLSYVRNKGVEDFRITINGQNEFQYDFKNYTTDSVAIYNNKLYKRKQDLSIALYEDCSDCLHYNEYQTADVIQYGGGVILDHCSAITGCEHYSHKTCSFSTNNSTHTDFRFVTNNPLAGKDKVSIEIKHDDNCNDSSYRTIVDQQIVKYLQVSNSLGVGFYINPSKNDTNLAQFYKINKDLTPNNTDIWEIKLIPIKIGTIDELKMFNIYNNSLTKGNINETLHIRIKPEANILVFSKTLAKQIKIGDFVFDLDCKQDEDGILPYTHITVALDNALELYNRYKDNKGYLDIELIPYPNGRAEIGNISTTNFVWDGVTTFDIRQEYKNYNELQPDEWGNVEFGNKPIVGRYIIKVVATWEQYKYAYRRHRSFQQEFCIIDLLDNYSDPDEIKEENGLQVKKMLWLNRAYFENISTATIVKDKNVKPQTVSYNITARELV